MVGRSSPDLLGRHVADGAEDHSRPGGGGDAAAFGATSVRVERRLELGQAEVQDLHPPVPGHEQVLGLQVPVNDALLVGRGQAVRDLNCVVDGFARGERTSPQALAQRHAVEKLEHDVGVAFVTAGVEDCEQVGMVEGAGGLRFLLEAAKPIGIAGRFRVQDLDGHLPPQSLIPGAVDLPHPARTERSLDLVRAQPGAGGEGGSLGGSAWCRQLPASASVDAVLSSARQPRTTAISRGAGSRVSSRK